MKGDFYQKTQRVILSPKEGKKDFSLRSGTVKYYLGFSDQRRVYIEGHKIIVPKNSDNIPSILEALENPEAKVTWGVFMEKEEDIIGINPDYAHLLVKGYYSLYGGILYGEINKPKSLVEQIRDALVVVSEMLFKGKEDVLGCLAGGYNVDYEEDFSKKDKKTVSHAIAALHFLTRSVRFRNLTEEQLKILETEHSIARNLFTDYTSIYPCPLEDLIIDPSK